MAESNEDFDLAKVQEFIRGQVETYAEQVFKERLPVEPTAPTKTQQEQAQDQLRDVINPFIQPGLNTVQLAVADLKDQVTFEASFKGSTEERKAVEDMFTQLKNAGKPLPRSDIRDYLEGKLLRESPEKAEEKLAQRKKQTEHLSDAVDFGSGALNRVKNDPQYDPKRMSLSELEAALEGVTF